MLNRHQDALMQRIDTAVHKGVSYLEWWELYSWYGMERISKAVWRDIKSRFDEIVENEGAELSIIDNYAGIILVRTDKLKNITEKIGD